MIFDLFGLIDRWSFRMLLYFRSILDGWRLSTAYLWTQTPTGLVDTASIASL